MGKHESAAMALQHCGPQQFTDINSHLAAVPPSNRGPELLATLRFAKIPGMAVVMQASTELGKYLKISNIEL